MRIEKMVMVVGKEDRGGAKGHGQIGSSRNSGRRLGLEGEEQNQNRIRAEQNKIE